MQTLHCSAPELTVGPANADVVGSDETAIQSAIQLAKSRNVGVVRIRKGTYRLKNSVILLSGITLAGEGEDTILQKALFAESPIVEDVNWYQRVVKVRDPELFPVGAGIRLIGTHIQRDSTVEVKATVTGKDGSALILNRPYIGENIWLPRGQPKVTALFPLIFAENQQDIGIMDLQLDGAVEAGGSGYAGGLTFMNCDRMHLRRLRSHHHDGSGIDWEICDNVTIEDCTFERTGMGMHVGSGSQHFVVRNCRVRDNRHGFYFCWGVQFGLLEDCEMCGNDDYGISIGFHDSHNVIRSNHIHDNAKMGVHFRAAHYPSQSPKGDLLENNRIENNGPADAPLGILMESEPERIVLRGNTILDTRGKRAGVGIRIESTVKSVTLESNRVNGFAQDIVDMR